MLDSERYKVMAVKISRTIAAAAGLASVINSGCMSVVTRSIGPIGPYPGVRSDVELMVDPMKSDVPIPRWICAIDMPFSAVFDTLALPFDLAWQTPSESKDSKSAEPKAH